MLGHSHSRVIWCHMAGMDQGSGMIHLHIVGPDAVGRLHATLPGLILTDAPVSSHGLQSALTYAVDCSFNSISIDGDISMNDMIIALANGTSTGVERSTTIKDMILTRRQIWMHTPQPMPPYIQRSSAATGNMASGNPTLTGVFESAQGVSHLYPQSRHQGKTIVIPPLTCCSPPHLGKHLGKYQCLTLGLCHRHPLVVIVSPR